MADEGYIKFSFRLIDNSAPSHEEIEDLNNLRTKLWDLSIIGAIGGVSFGNVSKRRGDNEFIISASNTGSRRVLTPEDFVIIYKTDFERNLVEYSGASPPSSETLTHSAVYLALPKVSFVVHFHNKDIWQALVDLCPTTPKQYQYGTPELAKSVYDLCFKYQNYEGIIILGGHFEGIVAFAGNVERLEKIIINLLDEPKRKENCAGRNAT